MVGEIVSGSALSTAACVNRLNESDVALIQHESDIYGGTHGDQLLDVMDGLRVPSVVTVHTVLKKPAPHQRWVLERVAAKADRVVVLSQAARARLCAQYAVERQRVTVVPRGATVARPLRGKRPSRPTIVTWGLLGPGKGIERVIEAMPSLRDLPGRPRYLVVGRTHPKVVVAEGEAYRDGLIERARLAGVSDSVTFDDRFYNESMLAELILSAAVIAVPYDSKDEIASGVLVDAVASGRPVVATAFPHAFELLAGGAGIVVDHGDQAAMAAALRKVITQPRLAGSLAAEARRIAPDLEWSVVAGAYMGLARRLLDDRKARV